MVSNERLSRIDYLRQLVAGHQRGLSRGAWPSSTLFCGIPKGAITEISGTAKIEWLVHFLKENPHLKVFWAEARFNLLPTALHQRGVCLNRFLFAECGNDLFSNIRKALRSHAFHCVVAPNRFHDERALKRLQLLVEQSGCSLILLSESTRPFWPICVQFRSNHCTTGSSPFEITVQKNKRGSSIEPMAPACE